VYAACFASEHSVGDLAAGQAEHCVVLGGALLDRDRPHFFQDAHWPFKFEIAVQRSIAVPARPATSVHAVCGLIAVQRRRLMIVVRK